MVLQYHRHKKPRHVPSHETTSDKNGGQPESCSEAAPLPEHATTQQELRRLCSFGSSKCFNKLSAVQERLEGIRSLLTPGQKGQRQKKLDTDRDDRECDNAHDGAGTDFRHYGLNSCCREITTSQKALSHVLLDMDLKETKQLHGFMILLSSHIISQYANTCQDIEWYGPQYQSVHDYWRCVSLISYILDELYQTRLLLPQTDNNDHRQLLSSAECQEAFDSCIQILECINIQRSMLGNHVEVEERDEHSTDSITETSTAEWSTAVHSCLLVLMQLGAHVSAVDADTLLMIMDACSSEKNLLPLMAIFLDSFDHSVDICTRQLAHVGRAAMTNADFDWDMNIHCDARNTIFNLQCMLRLRMKPLPKQEFVALVESLQVQAVLPTPEAGQAIDCLMQLCLREFLCPPSGKSLFQDTIMKVIRAILIKGGSCATPSILPGLALCRRNNLLPQLLGMSDNLMQQRLIASLVKLILSQQKSKSYGAMELIKARQHELVATKVLLDIMRAVVEHANDAIDASRRSSARICEQDLIGICVVLAEHDNMSVVGLVSVWLCNRLEHALHHTLTYGPTVLSCLGQIAQRFLRDKCRQDVIHRILSLWNSLAARKDSTVSATLARQSSVLSALLLASSSDSLSSETKTTAVGVLVDLSHDVCNRRILACHTGLLPCLIQFTRDFPPDLDREPLRLNRELIKKCIMDLAVAL